MIGYWFKALYLLAAWLLCLAGTVSHVLGWIGLAMFAAAAVYYFTRPEEGRLVYRDGSDGGGPATE